MNFCRRKNKADIAFWFFYRLQKCIKSPFTQHMDFIYDIDFFSQCCRRIEHFINNFLSNIIYSCMRSRINLYIIQTCSGIDEFTVCTMITWISILKVETIEPLSNQSCWSRFPSPSRSKKQIIVMYGIPRQHLSLENINNMLLTNHFIKRLWTILVCKAHELS